MKINYETKVNIKFANGNSVAFLGQGYIVSSDKKVFVRLYATSDLRHVVVNKKIFDSSIYITKMCLFVRMYTFK